MPASTTTKKRPAPRSHTCDVCQDALRTETDLMVHLVEQHDAVWTSTNSFALEDLLVPAPREAMDDSPAAADPGWWQRMVHRVAS